MAKVFNFIYVVYASCNSFSWIVSASEWVKKLFVTGSAIQRCYGQPHFDSLIPYYSEEGKHYSFILGQAKNAKKADGTALHNMQAPDYLMEESLNIFIQMDLGVETAHTASWAYNKTDGSLRIHAIGCSCDTFPFLIDLNIIPILNDMLGYSASGGPHMDITVENPNVDNNRLFVVNEGLDTW